MELGDELTPKVTSLAYGGEGVIKHNGITGFIRWVLPGELVNTRVTEIKKNYFRSQLLEIIELSPSRVTPRCPYFGQCGGCVYQHLSYEKQLEIKTQQLEELLKRIGKIPEVTISKVILSPKTYNYRNQITLKIKGNQLGYIGIDNKTFVPIEECPIAKEEINIKLKEITAKTNGELVIKCGADGTIDYAYREAVSEKGNYKLLHENIDNRIFYFSLSTFFQVNPYILPSILYELKGILDLGPDVTLFDLYCGAGLFSIYLAPYVKEVYGIELNPAAVRLGQKTNIGNCRFITGNAEDAITGIRRGKKDIFIVDPPRGGLSRDMLNYLKDMPPNQLAYISCEPAKLARDLNFLCQNSYRINTIILADMFPQTRHMETIILLSR